MAPLCRTFVIDDDPDMADLVATVIELADDGLRVAGVAHSGEEGVRRLADDAVDVVVIDYRMPDRNGIDVAAELLARTPEQHIVLFSAYLDEATRAAAAEIGVRECVSKERLRDLPSILRKYQHAA